MQKLKETKIYLTNTSDPFGVGFFNIFNTNDLKQVFVLVKNKEDVLYFKTIKIDDGSLVYDYTTLYKSKISDFKKHYPSKLIDSFDKYEIKYQHILLKHLIYLIDNGDWNKNNIKLDIKLIIELITNLIFKYNQIHQIIKLSPYYINGNDLYLRWNTYYQYSLQKTPIGINTTNNPYVVLYCDDYYHEVVFVNVNELDKVYLINIQHFNQYYFQKVSKFNYTQYHSSYQDVSLMQSIFKTISNNLVNKSLKIYHIDYKNELDLINDILYLELSIKQYIDNMGEEIENWDEMYEIRNQVRKEIDNAMKKN